MFAEKVAQREKKADLNSTKSLARQPSIPMVRRTPVTMRAGEVASQPGGANFDFSRIPIHRPATDHKITGEIGPARRLATEMISTYAWHEQAAEKRSADYVGIPPGATPLVDLSRFDQGGGTPMSHALRQMMRPSFDATVDDARIHTDLTAVGAMRGLGLDAFTVGRDIYVDPDRYRTTGPALVAHELTHVGQQMATGTRAFQPKVRFTGTAAALAKVIALINASLDIRYRASLSGTGDLSIAPSGNEGPPTLMQSEFTTRIQAIIGDAGLVNEGETEGGVPLVGSWTLRQIDVDDMNALGVDKPGWNAGGSLIHELTEQREGQVGGVTNFPAAHATATAAENAVIGATQESDTPNMTPSGNGLVSGTRTTVFRYPDGTRWRVIVTVVNNNVTNVDRVQLP